MGMPRRFAVPSDCLNCTLRQNGDFCQLPPSLLTMLNGMGHLTIYPVNATLIEEGQAPRGVYITCSGRAKLSVEAKGGKTVILRIAGERQVMGMSAVITSGPSLVTVTTIELCQIKFVEREGFLRLLQSDSRAAMACAAMLAQEINSSFSDVHELLLARSSTEKLARLLLSWIPNESRNRELRITAEFTHEEMAQMIGSSRETVTRLLSDLRRKELIRLEGETLVIPDRVALQAIAS
jgi:CRP/FNR family transcriptional regulator, cyclic AMP receptor protein